MRDTEKTKEQLLDELAQLRQQVQALQQREEQLQQVETALQQRETELRLITNSLPVLISFIDSQQRYRFVNQTYEQWFGRPSREVCGQYLWDVLGEVAYTGVRPYVEQVLAGHPVSFESEMRYKDIATRMISAVFVPRFEAQGQISGFVALVSDITERQQAETALRESEARFQAIARNVPGMIYRYAPRADGSDAFTYVSSGSRDLLELEPAEILQDASCVWNLFHPDDLPSLQESVAIAIQNLQPWQWEGRLITPSGRLKWIQGKSRPESTADGMVWDGLLIDITERQQAEQSLRESEAWARLAIQVGRLGGWRLHLDTNLVEMDPRMREIWGEPEDAVMVPLPQVLERMHPDDRDRVAAAVSAAIDPQSSGTYEIEYRLVWPDGSEHWVLAKGQAQFAGEGESRRTLDFFGTLLDITARKQTEAALRISEERLHSFVSANVIGILFGDLEGGIQEANDEFLRIVGYTREELQAGKLRWVDITPPEYLPLDEKAIVEARSRGACTPYEKEYMRRDGQRIPVFVGFSLAYAVREEAVAFILDLSDRKAIEAEREQLLQREQLAREQAEAANRVKDEFLAVLSHELRTPLNPILGWTKLLRTRSFDAAATDRALSTIERNAKLQAQLIEDLLDVSRILQGKVRLEAHPVDLEATIEAALETVRLSAEAKGIQIRTVFDSATGQTNGDANRLQQVVWNLLSNAIKFTPAGGQVEVRLEGIGTHAQIQVTDTGQGIGPDFLPYVFEYFRQADSSMTRQFGGLGLGLAIVRHLVELHGGVVKAESPGLGMGATFTVQLPLMVSSPNSGLAPQLPAPATHRLQDISILVVDDEADMRELIRFILEEQGATVRVAATAAEALQQISDSLPDIAISDIGMPEMDGYTLIRKIRMNSSQQGKMIPAIALTAYAGDFNEQRALAAGFQRHLAKPIEPEQLLVAIAQVLTNN